MTIMLLVTSLDRALLHQLLSLARWPALGSVLVVSNFFPLGLTETCFCEPSMLQKKKKEKSSVPFPRSVSRYNPVSEVYRQFLGLHGLVCALTCIVSCGTLYRQVCAFPNYVQSTEFTTGVLQSSCRKIRSMISENICIYFELNFECHGIGCEYLWTCD